MLRIRLRWTKHRYHSTVSTWPESFPLQKAKLHTSKGVENDMNKKRSNPTLTPSSTQRDHAVSPLIAPWLQSLPPSWMPYVQLARMDKPIGTVLLLYPCLWSSTMAYYPILVNKTLSWSDLHLVIGDPYLITLFAAGAFIMRGAGCTINDMWDAKYDRRVTRTQDRPLASGKISMFPNATIFLGAQLLSGLAILLSFPTQHLYFCFAVGISSMPLVVLYPLMKRFTNWPQLVLGLTFNWGAWMGWAAVHGSFTDTVAGVHGISVIAPLYVGSVAWTLVYDTLYAHQDKADDRKLGLKSTALYFGDNDTKQRLVLSSFALIAGSGWMVSGYQLGLDMNQLMMHPVSSLYYIGCFGAMGHLLWQVQIAKFDDAQNLSRRFKSNSVVGTMLLGSCIMGNVGLFI